MKNLLFILLVSVLFASCTKDEEEEVSPILDFYKVIMKSPEAGKTFIEFRFVDIPIGNETSGVRGRSVGTSDGILRAKFFAEADSPYYVELATAFKAKNSHRIKIIIHFEDGPNAVAEAFIRVLENQEYVFSVDNSGRFEY